MAAAAYVAERQRSWAVLRDPERPVIEHSVGVRLPFPCVD